MNLNKLYAISRNEDRQHPYRNIVKMQSISDMRIGKVLARSIIDYDKDTNCIPTALLLKNKPCKMLIFQHIQGFIMW